MKKSLIELTAANIEEQVKELERMRKEGKTIQEQGVKKSGNVRKKA